MRHLEKRWFSKLFNINLITIGRLKEDYWRKASAEYEKRLGAFCKIKIIELEESKLPENPSIKEINIALENESKAILKNISGCIISLCIEGEQFSSEKFAEKIDALGIDGNSTLNFIIGSSHGLSDNLKEKSKIKISMSKMTFPHQMARILLLEQIYRAFMIINNNKYHK